MDKKKEAHNPLHGKGEVGMGLKLFLADLTIILPAESIKQLASSFGFSKTMCHNLDTSDHPVNTMIEFLLEREIITSNNISQLIKALESLEQTTISNKIMTSFQKWSSRFPEKQPPKKVKATKVKSEPRKVREAVTRINNSDKEIEKKPEPRKVLEAAKRIDDVEQNNKRKPGNGKVLEAVKRIDSTKEIKRITTEDGRVTEELSRIVDSEKAERRAKVERKITEAINHGSESKRFEQDNMPEAELSAVHKEHFERFLKHVDLSLVNKMTMKDRTCMKLFSNNNEETEDSASRFLMHLATGDFLVTEKLTTTYTYQQGYAKSVCKISKKDFLFAILTCCDLFMLQDVVGKLYNCRRAVPVIFPSVSSSRPTFFLWGLLKCRQNIYAKEALTTTTTPFCTQPLITISALRFGNIKFSKSHILNKLLGTLKTDQDLRCFISREEDPENSIWSEGMVEITWNIDKKGKGIHGALPSFSLLNLRGDGLRHIRQVKFCVNVSNIIIVYLSLRLTGKYIQEINQMTASSRVIVVLDCTERDAINLSSSEKLTFLFGAGLTPQEISEKIKIYLLAHIKSKEGKLWSGKSLEDHYNACSLFGIDVDEDNFKEAKTLAIKIGNTISLSVDQSKSRIFSSQISSEICNQSVDEVNGNEMLQEDLKTPLSYTFNTFLKGISLDDQGRKIFLSLLGIILDEKSCKAMSSYLQQYQSHAGVGREKQNEGDEQFVHKGLNLGDISSLEKNMEENLLTVDNFLFHLWRLVQCSHASLPKDFTFDAYQAFLGSWLLNGNSIDIFDPFYSLAPWPQTVLKALQTVLKQEKVLVVTAFGNTGNSKSRMLTHLFNANFIFSEIMWPSGIRIHLISIENKFVESLGFDFILLADVENVRLSEILSDGLTERRIKICNVLSSVTDLLLLSLDHDIAKVEEAVVFDIVVKGLLTNSKCKVSTQCCVVYHKEKVTDFDIQSLEAHTLNNLKDSCSKIGRIIGTDESDSSLEECDLFDTVCEKFTCSARNQDSKLRVKVLPSLENNTSHDDNQAYVQNLHNLRDYILQILTDPRHGSSTLNGISENISSCFCNTTSLDDESYGNDVGD
ncbi:Interferon-induced very large GTPase 1 [Holothuria leucospilota]|uniref:Interferon-induced very large GTPase 1 n=1 Tax=Holothuria leucospilota TaxID=206669 RepID=A0A9Q1CSM6_HOLLE|nr:Interferon-induced very large GTPase 1 [Holothuria leucospilota]